MILSNLIHNHRIREHVVSFWFQIWNKKYAIQNGSNIQNKNLKKIRMIYIKIDIWWFYNSLIIARNGNFSVIHPVSRESTTLL